MFGSSEKSRTFASAFATKLAASENKKKEFFERFTYTEVVQEASTQNPFGR